MEQYKQLITENWKWSIFHRHISDLMKIIALVSAIVLALIYMLLSNVRSDALQIDFRKKATASVVDQNNYPRDVLNFFDVRIEPVRISEEEIESRYYAASDLQKLEEMIVADLNSKGKISVDHIEITPAEYVEKAQNPDFMQIKISDDIIVFCSIIYGDNHISRFIAIARKLDKWRLAVIKSPVTSTNKVLIHQLRNTSELIAQKINNK